VGNGTVYGESRRFTAVRSARQPRMRRARPMPRQAGSGLKLTLRARTGHVRPVRRPADVLRRHGPKGYGKRPPKVEADGSFTFAGVPAGHSLGYVRGARLGFRAVLAHDGPPAAVTIRKAGAVRIAFDARERPESRRLRSAITVQLSATCSKRPTDSDGKAAAEIALADLPRAVPDRLTVYRPRAGFPKFVWRTVT